VSALSDKILKLERDVQLGRLGLCFQAIFIHVALSVKLNQQEQNETSLPIIAFSFFGVENVLLPTFFSLLSCSAMDFEVASRICKQVGLSFFAYNQHSKMEACCLEAGNTGTSQCAWMLIATSESVC